MVGIGCEGLGLPSSGGFTILPNVTDASDMKFRVCDLSRLSGLRRFQQWHVFALHVVKMLSCQGRKDA